MRPKAGDPPRTMAQKILWARDAANKGAKAAGRVRVDQIVLARDPAGVVARAVERGLKSAGVEVALAYETTAITDVAHRPDPLAPAMLARGVHVARAGAGFAPMVHLERFASPARLCLTDDPRLAAVTGGVGMMSLAVDGATLAEALAGGDVKMAAPRTVQVQLSGKPRPFVCARDVALELSRRGVGDVVAEVAAKSDGAPVVLEIGGPSARLLSVGERAVVCSAAPRLGAATAVFVADERTEVFLRDQRRSKAHRALAPDPGAPADEVVAVDLGGIDPLVADETGKVRAVRDCQGAPVAQALLGGDSGVTLRDLFAVAALLKSKRVPPRVDFLLAVPSRQMLEVLAQAGALADLVAVGARIVEPDARVVTGELYPPPRAGLSVRTADIAGPAAGASNGNVVVVSAETLAWSVATGVLGDPRGFKRPARVTVPRALPTDDVLVVRDKKALAPRQT